MANQQHNNKGNKDLNNYLKYSSLGFQMIVIIGVFTYIGHLIDERNQTKQPLFTAFFSLLGVIIALYQVFRSLKNTK